MSRPAYALRYALNRGRISECIRAVKAREEAGDLGGLIDFSSTVAGGLIKPLQRKGEILEFLQFLRARRIGSMMEVGTANGGTLFLFSRVLRPDALMISLDLPAGLDYGYQDYKVPLYLSFARGRQRIHLLRNDSHAAATPGKARALLRGKKLDFLFIDGDHSYEGVKKDFKMYSPLVRKGGIIAFHDIMPQPAWMRCEVGRFWGEVKRSYRYREIPRKAAPGAFGIGILFK